MLFSTKLTPLINTRGLIDSDSLETHHNNRRNSGSHKWPKTVFGWCISINAPKILINIGSSNSLVIGDIKPSSVSMYPYRK